MATLVSPGVAVSITDESQYGSAGQGTVPLIILATESNKTNVSGTGYATGTLPINANKPYLLTSQRELVELFGQPQFKVIDGTPINGAETNEYGLMAAYSFLGLANRAYVLRADIDLAQIEPSIEEPAGAPADGTYWLDASSTSWGVFESTATGTGHWVAKTPSVITELSKITDAGAPVQSYGSNGDYAVVSTSSVSSHQLYKKIAGTWTICTSAALPGTVFVAEHYNIPTATAIGDVWIKTTTPNNGLKLVVKKYNSALLPRSSPWQIQSVPVYASDEAASAGFGSLLSIGKIYAKTTANSANIELRLYTTHWVSLNEQTSDMAPMGAPADGALWYNTNLLADLYVKVAGGWQPVSGEVTIDASVPSNPSTNDIWIDSSDIENYPAIYVWDGSNWIARDVTDQTTPNGIIFADLTATAADSSNGGVATLVDDQAPNPALYPAGMMCWNSIVSTGNVKQYNAITGVWSTFSGNKANGSPYMLRKAQRQAVVKAMQAAVSSNQSIREEMTYFTLIAAPGYTELLDEMVTLNTDRKETAFIVVDTPFRLNPQGQTLVNWMTGVNATSNGEDGIITSTSSAAAYYPSGLATDLSGNNVVVPASHMVLRTMAYNDQVSYPWFAPAGLARGVVTNASNVGYINAEGEFVTLALTNGQRDVLYGDGSRVGINPITRFPGQGLYVFGQRTLQSFSSALDRVNVARLLAYLRERFDPLARPFIFEPNDKFTRSNVKQVFDSFLGDLLSKRAIYDFIVVCDETNNTPAKIDRNELWIDIAIEPVKAAEFIYIPIRVVNTGELS
jgi:hypothetical protein